MGKAGTFRPVKLISGLIAREDSVFDGASRLLVEKFGPIDSESPCFPFDRTDYYREEMGAPLIRRFLSFETVIRPEGLSDIKLITNALESRLKGPDRWTGRPVNIDPGILSASSLVMATVKDFAHRIPLRDGIYAHLELLFGRDEVRVLPWTYPDFQSPGYHAYFLEVRRLLLRQLKP